MPITYFKCSKCKMTRDSYEEAERCEQSHLSAISVREIEYCLGAYPFRISISFPDGKEVMYTKED